MRIEWKREWIIPSVVGVVSFGAGVGTGYALWLRHAKGLHEEVQVLRDFMDRIESEAKIDLERSMEIIEIEEIELLPVPEPFVLDDFEVRRSKDVHPTVTHIHIEEPEAPESTSVFSVPNEENWDYEVEERARTLAPNRPYVIHRDEYMDQDEDAYSQSTLTYYKGDDILCDEHDVPIYNIENVTGPLDFGRGSGDQNIVYIRNDRLRAEYEVLLDHGYFQVEILGQEFEQKFENKKEVLPKFRSVD